MRTPSTQANHAIQVQRCAEAVRRKCFSSPRQSSILTSCYLDRQIKKYWGSMECFASNWEKHIYRSMSESQHLRIMSNMRSCISLVGYGIFEKHAHDQIRRNWQRQCKKAHQTSLDTLISPHEAQKLVGQLIWFALGFRPILSTLNHAFRYEASQEASNDEQLGTHYEKLKFLQISCLCQEWVSFLKFPLRSWLSMRHSKQALFKSRPQKSWWSQLSFYVLETLCQRPAKLVRSYFP